MLLQLYRTVFAFNYHGVLQPLQVHDDDTRTNSSPDAVSVDGSHWNADAICHTSSIRSAYVCTNSGAYACADASTNACAYVGINASAYVLNNSGTNMLV
jgi:hypothetical protein